MLTISRHKLYQILMATIIVVFTTVLYWFVRDGVMNQLMLGMMYAAPFLLIILFPSFRQDEIPLFLLFGVMLATALMHFESFRLSTIMYSALFIITFILYRRLLLTGYMDINSYLNIIRKIIYAYAIVLIIQQISTILGIPVFNKCWDYPARFKLNSLALEASHVGRILFLLQFSFINVREIILNRKYSLKKDFLVDKWVWCSFLYVSITNGSLITLIALFLLLVYLVGKNVLLGGGIILIGFLSSFIFIDEKILMQVDAVRRFVTIIPAILSLDSTQIINVDLSGAARIAPVFFYFEHIDIFSVAFWLGHGIDFSNNNVIFWLLGRDSEQGTATGGLFPAFFLDYGMIAGLLFLFVLRQMTMTRWCSFPMLAWLILFLSNSFNTYIQWAFFIIMVSTLFFKTHYKDAFHVKS